MFDVLEGVRLGDDYTELRWHDRTARRVLVENGKIETVRSQRHCGVGVRVFHKGAWGFASTSLLDPASVQAAVARAETAAKAAAKVRTGEAKTLATGTLGQGDFVTEAHRRVSELPFGEKIDLCVRIENSLKQLGQRVTSGATGYTELIDEKFILTSDGARVHLVDEKPEFRVNVVSQLEGDLQSHTEASGHTGGLTELFARMSPEEMAERAVKMSTDLLRAGYVDGGKVQAILTPAVLGLLVHEAIGHTVEADFVLSGSAAAGKLGQKVASDLVTLCDSGHSEHQPGAGGVVLVDDEGVPTQKTTIIERGVLKGYLHNRETAAKFGVEPTGNARAFEYDDVPLIRMRNTYIEPGETKLEEMIADTKDGVLLAGAKNGQADANAEFMFVVGEVYPIKNGKLGPLHRGTTITGDAFEVLGSVDRVGDQFEWDLGSGYCGKGQQAKVDAGGPHVRCELTLAGQEGA